MAIIFFLNVESLYQYYIHNSLNVCIIQFLFIYVVITNDECWGLVDTIPPPAPQVHYPSEASGNWFKIYTYFVTCCFTMVDQLTLYVEQLADTYTSFACQNLYKIQLECMQEDYILGRYHGFIHIELSSLL